MNGGLVGSPAAGINRMDTTPKPRAWQTLLAFAIIYFVWGSTFLAIRVGVREVPPFLLAGMRFLAAGGVLYGWMRAKGARSPALREWGAASLLALLIFVLDYGLLFWAEQRVPSGVAAVMMATIPVFMVLSEILILGTQRLTARLAIALLVGIGGVAVLVSRTLSFGEGPIDTAGACSLVVAAISWSVAAALTRKLPLPAAKVMSSGAQMLAGAADVDGSSAWRVPGISDLVGFTRGVVRAGIPDRGGVNRCVHSLRVADSSRIAHQGGDLRIREPGGGGGARIFSWRRGGWSPHTGGDGAGAGERDRHNDDAGEAARTRQV